LRLDREAVILGNGKRCAWLGVHRALISSERLTVASSRLWEPVVLWDVLRFESPVAGGSFGVCHGAGGGCMDIADRVACASGAADRWSMGSHRGICVFGWLLSSHSSVCNSSAVAGSTVGALSSVFDSVQTGFVRRSVFAIERDMSCERSLTVGACLLRLLAGPRRCAV